MSLSSPADSQQLPNTPPHITAANSTQISPRVAPRGSDEAQALMSSSTPVAEAPTSPATQPAPTCITGALCAGSVPSCHLSRVMLLVTWIALLLAFDQASKLYAMQHWKPTALEPLVFLNGVFRIQYAENPGAFLGLFGGLDAGVRFWVLTWMNAAILGAVSVFLILGKPRDLWSWTALTLILAGGIGNLIDRIRFDNHVIDFLILSTGPVNVPYFGEVRTGIFNIADIAITAGFLMLLPGILRPPQSEEAK